MSVNEDLMNMLKQRQYLFIQKRSGNQERRRYAVGAFTGIIMISMVISPVVFLLIGSTPQTRNLVIGLLGFLYLFFLFVIGIKIVTIPRETFEVVFDGLEKCVLDFLWFVEAFKLGDSEVDRGMWIKPKPFRPAVASESWFPLVEGEESSEGDFSQGLCHHFWLTNDFCGV